MSEQAELEGLKGVISDVAFAQQEEMNGRGPARDAGGGSIVYISCNGNNLHANSWTGQAGWWPGKPTTPFARTDAGGKTYLSSLDLDEGSFRFFRGLTESTYGQIDLSGTSTDPQTAWNLTAVGSGYLLTVDGPGPKRILSTNGMIESIPANAFGVPDYSKVLWTFSDTPSAGVETPVPPPVEPSEPITAEAYWWGFHFVVPESHMEAWTAGGILAGEVVELASTFCGPASVFVAAFGEYLVAEFEAAKAVDNGNGVYVSMSWFAPALFVPTSR